MWDWQIWKHNVKTESETGQNRFGESKNNTLRNSILLYQEPNREQLVLPLNPPTIYSVLNL